MAHTTIYMSIIVTILSIQRMENIPRRLRELGEQQNGGIRNSGTHRQMIDSYLCEFLWREDAKRRGVDEFENILAKIVDFMPPNNPFEKIKKMTCG